MKKALLKTIRNDIKRKDFLKIYAMQLYRYIFELLWNVPENSSLIKYFSKLQYTSGKFELLRDQHK